VSVVVGRGIFVYLHYFPHGATKRNFLFIAMGLGRQSNNMMWHFHIHHFCFQSPPALHVHRHRPASYYNDNLRSRHMYSPSTPLSQPVSVPSCSFLIVHRHLPTLINVNLKTVSSSTSLVPALSPWWSSRTGTICTAFTPLWIYRSCHRS